MTDSSSASIPPGWYPDSTNPALQRWWDGTQWTEHTQQAYVAGGVVAEQLRAPEGTNWNTPWIWLVIFLPLLSLVPLFFMDFNGLVDASNPTGVMDTRELFAFYLQPSVILATVLGWLVTAAVILFAFLDYRELKRRGVPQPFHWGLSFLALAGLSVVYAIGRGVVTKRRTGGGGIVTVVAILSIVLMVVVIIIWTTVLTVSVMNQVLDTLPTR